MINKEHQYRKKLGLPIKTCMVCSAVLKSEKELEHGLCGKHYHKIIIPPPQISRCFGRGLEYQLLGHTDELDDILYKLEHEKEPDLDNPGDFYDGFNYEEPQKEAGYLAFAHYIAGIFLHRLINIIDLAAFDRITFTNLHFICMDYVFLEMGYIAQREKHSYAEYFMNDKLNTLSNGEKDYLFQHIKGKKILLLDLYRSFDTRARMDLFKLLGAGEVTTVYLTSYS